MDSWSKFQPHYKTVRVGGGTRIGMQSMLIGYSVCLSVGEFSGLNDTERYQLRDGRTRGATLGNSADP